MAHHSFIDMFIKFARYYEIGNMRKNVSCTGCRINGSVYIPLEVLIQTIS